MTWPSDLIDVTKVDAGTDKFDRDLIYQIAKAVEAIILARDKVAPDDGIASLVNGKVPDIQINTTNPALKGPKGDAGPVPIPIWDGTRLRFIQSNNRGRTLADYVDLKGNAGPAGPRPAHEWSGTRLRFQNPDGSWGAYVDLKGDKGDSGSGSGGGGGGGGHTPAPR